MLRSKLIVMTQLLLFCLLCGAVHAEDVRLGIVGTDSSHSVQFARILNNTSAPNHIAGAKIVMAYRGGNPRLALSRDRIEAFTSELEKTWAIPFVSSIRDLCSNVDGILLLSVDPAARLREFKEAATCHKPIFIDKPAASTVDDVLAIDQLAKQAGVLWFSASALRFLQPADGKAVLSADVWGPGELGKSIDGYPLDLAWYGIHSIDAISAAMGPGISKVSRVHTKDDDVITAVWDDGRVGTIHLIRPEAPFHIRLRFASGQTVDTDMKVDYAPLVEAIVRLVRDKTVPVLGSETLEVFAVMEAAQESLKRDGLSVPVKHY